jgi:hypothetical protein
MMIYAISYTSYEDSTVVYLQHKKVYTPKQFENLVIKAAVELCKLLKRGKPLEKKLVNGPCATSPTNITRILGGRSSEWPCIGSVSDLFPDLGIFMEKYGFKVVNPVHDVCFWGWSDPFVKDDWKGNQSPTDKKLVEALRKAGFTDKDSRRQEARKRRGLRP